MDLSDSQTETVHLTNTIRNRSPDEENKDEPFDRQMGQPLLRTVINPSYPQTTKVMASDLSQFVKSKDDLYYIMSIEGQLHLPPYDECTMQFLREVLKGSKKLLHNRQVSTINVPRLREFNAQHLYEMALEDKEARYYLPEPITLKKQSISRRFLFNIINTLRPEYFGVEIQRALQTRKEKEAITNNRFVEMEQSMLALIQGSTHVSKGTRGRALSLLNTNTKKRTRQMMQAGDQEHEQEQVQQVQQQDQNSIQRAATQAQRGTGMFNMLLTSADAAPIQTRF